MMTHREAEAMLRSAGFKLARSGKHQTYEHPDGRQTRLPQRNGTATLSKGVATRIRKITTTCTPPGDS